MEADHTLYVKNMVCNRCILAVNQICNALQISFDTIMLGTVIIAQKLQSDKYNALNSALNEVGLEIIESRAQKITNDIKRVLVEYLELGIDSQQYKLSAFIASRLHYEFGYLSDVFSSVEGVSIERFYILQRIEKVKELIICGELSLSEISYQAGFSSVHHLSAQFKKITGFTPSEFRNSGPRECKPSDYMVQ